MYKLNNAIEPNCEKDLNNLQQDKCDVSYYREQPSISRGQSIRNFLVIVIVLVCLQ
jgi:hypothetical protein